MNRTHQLRRPIALCAIAAILATIGAPARAADPQRSGTIVGGTGETPISPWVRGMEGCVGTPTCSAWLQSSCDPALAGADPALQAAIVDVGDLADGVTQRILNLRGGLGSGIPVLNWGDFFVQFWTEKDPSGPLLGCGEISASRLTSWECDRSRIGSGSTAWNSPAIRCAFHVPSDAKWMTISSSPESAEIRWTLA